MASMVSTPRGEKMWLSMKDQPAASSTTVPGSTRMPCCCPAIPPRPAWRRGRRTRRRSRARLLSHRAPAPVVAARPGLRAARQRCPRRSRPPHPGRYTRRRRPPRRSRRPSGPPGERRRVAVRRNSTTNPNASSGKTGSRTMCSHTQRWAVAADSPLGWTRPASASSTGPSITSTSVGTGPRRRRRGPRFASIMAVAAFGIAHLGKPSCWSLFGFFGGASSASSRPAAVERPPSTSCWAAMSRPISWIRGRAASAAPSRAATRTEQQQPGRADRGAAQPAPQMVDPIPA